MENFIPPKRPEPTYYDSSGAHYGPPPGAAPQAAAPAGPYPPMPQPPKPPPGAVPPMIARPAEVVPEQPRQLTDDERRMLEPTLAARRIAQGSPGRLVKGQQNALVGTQTEWAGEVAVPGQEEALANARIDQQLAEQRMLDLQREGIGVEDAANQERLQAQREVDFHTEMLRKDERDAIAARTAERKRIADARMGEISSYLDQQQAEIERNPRHSMYASQSTMGQFLTGIGIALGGVAAGIQGGKNPAMEMIDKGVEEEIQRQRAVADNLGKRAAGARIALADLRQQWGDDDAADHSARALMYTTAKAQLDTIAAQQGTREAALNASLLGAELESKRADAAKQAVTAGQKRVWTDTQDRVVGGAPGGAGALAAEAKLRYPGDQAAQAEFIRAGLSGTAVRDVSTAAMSSEQKNAKEVADKDLAREVRLPEYLGGGTAYAQSPERAEKTTKALVVMDQIRRNRESAQKILAQSGGSSRTLGPTDMKQLQLLAQHNVSLTAQAMEMGALAEGEKANTYGLAAMASSDRWDLQTAQEAFKLAGTIEQNMANGLTRTLRTGTTAKTPYVQQGIKFERRD